MREIYLLNNGDSIKKISFELGKENIKVAPDKLFGYKYAIIESGTDDISVVKNYLPAFVYKVKKEDNYLDILARGFTIDSNDNINADDIIILKKPRSIRYVVSPLETLDQIAYKFGTKEEDIMINNNLSTNKLFVGQILWI